MKACLRDPQAPWQKGAVENLNRRARRWLPRDTPVATLADDAMRTICERLNSTPRKRPGHRTPAEALRAEMRQVTHTTEMPQPNSSPHWRILFSRVTTSWHSFGTDLRRVFEDGVEMAEHELGLRPSAHGRGAIALSQADAGNHIVLTGSLSDAPWSCLILTTDPADLDLVLDTAGIELEAVEASGFQSYYAEVGPLPGGPADRFRAVVAFSIDPDTLAQHGIETDLVGGLDIRRD